MRFTACMSLIDPAPTFHLKAAGLGATAQIREGSFVVLAGSHARTHPVDSFASHTYSALRQSLIASGHLMPDASSATLLLTADVPFRSASAAAAVLLGRAANGRTEWVTPDAAGQDIAYAEWQARHPSAVLPGDEDGLEGAPLLWPPFFRELAVKLLEFEDRQSDLVQLLRDASVHVQHDQGEPLTVMDPFSFFSLILKHQSDSRVAEILTRLKTALDLREPVPADLTGVPWSNPMNAWFFAYRSNRQSEDLPTLWALARQAVLGELEDATFARALEIRQVALPKLTTGLFWLNPDRYLALNGVNVPYLEQRGLRGAGQVQNLTQYRAVLEAARPLAVSYPALSHQAWLVTQRGKSVAQMDGEAFPFRAFQAEAAGYKLDMAKGNTQLDRRYAPLLLSLIGELQDLRTLTAERQPYTASKQLGVKVELGRGQADGPSWFGMAFLFPEPANEYQAVGAGLNLKLVFPDGRHDFIQLALQDVELRERFAQVLASGGDQPGAFALNTQFQMNDGVAVTEDTLPTVCAALELYANSVGRSTRLQVDQFLTPEVLESDDFPEVLERALRYLDDVATVMEEIVQTGLQQRSLQAEAPTIEVMTSSVPASDSETFTPVPGVPLNQILYGPPGTGKTFRVVDDALSVLDPAALHQHPGASGRAARKARYDELVAQGRVSFVTFHQSFGYEDFIEGLKPVMEHGQLSYRLEDGVFLNAVRAAGGQLDQPSGQRDPSPGAVHPNGQVWRMYIDGTVLPSSIRDLSLARGELRMGSWGRTPRDLSEASVEELSARQLLFRDSVRVGDLVLLATGMNSVGAVGVVTGEYQFDPYSDPLFAADYAHARAVRWLATDLQLSAQALSGKQFSPPTLQRVADASASEVLSRLPLLQAQAASTPQLQPHVLIIDEINRGNVSKIFGELITLLEAGKRAGSPEALTITLPLSRRRLTVPQSLYVVGTMNTADRSLTLLDAALRRRFVFRPVWPQPELLPVIEIDGVGLDLRKFLHVINERIERLLSREQVIGHAYLLGVPATLDGVASAVRERILPLLEEYFFEDWGKIREVFADEGKAENLQFIRLHRAGGESRYRVNEAAFGDVEAFTRVYSHVDDSAFPFTS